MVVLDVPQSRGCSQHPDAIFAIPAVFSINLPKLSFISCDQDGDRNRALLRISNQFHDVALRDRILVLVVHRQTGL